MVKKEKALPDALVPLVAGAFGALGISAGLPVLGVATAGASIAWYLSQKLYRSKLDRFFEMAKLETDIRRPQLVSRKRLSKGIYEYRYRLPGGMSTDDFTAKKLAMEQYLRASVDIAFDANMVIKVYEEGFKDVYPFVQVRTDRPLAFCAGYRKNGDQLLYDIETGPHLLISGAPGAGKSVFLRSMLTGLLLGKRPEELEVILADFQRVELNIFKRSPLVSDFCTSPTEFMAVLGRLAVESDRRLTLFEKADVVNIQGYNAKAKKPLPYVLVVVDEFASLAEHKDILGALKIRLAQDRKCGINYVLCTQRPSADIVSGTIKAVMPARIAFKAASRVDSSVVLDEPGAEQLQGKGHGLLKNVETVEFKGMFLSETEAYAMLKPTFIEKKEMKPDAQPIYSQGPPSAPLY